MNHNYEFYSEWIEYSNEKEKEEGRQYLQLWKKFTLRKLKTRKFVDEQWVDKEIMPLDCCDSFPGTIALKICTIIDYETKST